MDKAFEMNDARYVVELVKINLPEESKFEEKKDDFSKKAQREANSFLSVSLINKLKSREEIDINPAMLQ